MHCNRQAKAHVTEVQQWRREWTCFLGEALVGWVCKVWSSNMQRCHRWNQTKAVKPLPCSTDCGRASVLQRPALCYVGTTHLWIWHRFSLRALLIKDCVTPGTFCLKSIKAVLLSVLLYTCSHSNHWNLKILYELYCSQHILFIYMNYTHYYCVWTNVQFMRQGIWFLLFPITFHIKVTWYKIEQWFHVL